MVSKVNAAARFLRHLNTCSDILCRDSLAGLPLPQKPAGLAAEVRDRCAARARVQQLGHVADPREPLPEVLRAVDAERQQQVLRRKTPDLVAAEGQRPGALPHVFTYGKLRELFRREAPVQLDYEPARVARVCDVVLTPEQKLFLRL